MANGTSNCEYARNRNHNTVLWLNLWTGLLFVFGGVIVLTLSIIVFTLLRPQPSWVAGSIATLATIVDGVAIKWVYSRRQEAVKEEGDAYNEVVKQCSVPPGTAQASAAVPATVQAAMSLGSVTKFANFFRPVP